MILHGPIAHREQDSPDSQYLQGGCCIWRFQTVSMPSPHHQVKGFAFSSVVRSFFFCSINYGFKSDIRALSSSQTASRSGQLGFWFLGHLTHTISIDIW